MPTLRNYTIGFVLSVLLTLFAFWTVPGLPPALIYPALILAALAQLVIQLVCFLHLGRESGPRWNLTLFAFTFIIVAILVGGSLWIMYNLQHTMLMPQDAPGTFLPSGITPQNELD